MPFVFGAATKLSQLVIDVPLDMRGRDVQNVGTLYGNKEVLSVEETLTKQTLLPTMGGAVALVIRDVSNSVDRVVMKEDGTAEVRQIAVGDLSFANGWKVTEEGPELIWLSPEGKKYRLVLEVKRDGGVSH